MANDLKIKGCMKYDKCKLNCKRKSVIKKQLWFNEFIEPEFKGEDCLSRKVPKEEIKQLIDDLL